jgi:hypothetical protein
MITNSNILKKEPVPPLVKVRDVAALLSVSRQTVHHLIQSGDLEGSAVTPRTKVRRHLRVTRNSLLTFYKKRFGHSLTRALENPFEPSSATAP